MKHGGRVLILLLSLLFLVLNINVVNAESNVIVIDSVETVGGTIDVDSPVLDSNKITSKIKFENKDDYITFKLNIKNNNTQPLYLKSVSDNNTINNLSITYDYSDGLVNPNEITSIKVTFKYAETVKNVDKVNIDNLVIKLLFVDEEGETKGDDIIINPTTHDSILKYIIWLVIAFVGIVLSFIYIKDKKLKYSVFVLCFSLIIIPTIIYANGEYEFNAIFTDIELVGEYETYEINIYNKDRNVVDTKTITYGQKVGTLTHEEVPGYTFDKYVDENGNEVTEDTVVTGPISIIEKYNPNTYEVVFDKNSEYAEGSMNNQQMTYDTEANFDDTTYTYTGYHLTGWNTNPTGTGTSYSVNTPVKNIATEGTITLYAEWEENTDTPYVVIHKQQQLDGSYVESDRDELTGTTGATITPTVNSYTGFTSPTAVTTTISRFGTTEVVYEYDRVPCELTITDRTYLSNGSSANGTYMYGETITLTAQERNNYNFKWSDDDTNYTKQFTITDDVTLSLVYTAQTYEVVFDKNSEFAEGTMDAQTLTYDTAANLTTNAFTYTGYHFNGWNTVAGGTGTSYADGVEVTNITENNSITLYAQWEANTNTQYVVIHKQQQLDGSYVESDRDELTGTSDASITTAVKSYTGFTSPTAVTTTISRFGTTEVVYEYDRLPCELTITDRTYLVSGSSANGTYMYGETITLTAQERNHYDFKWSDNDTNYTKQFTITEDMTLETIYTLERVTVTFDSNGGGEVNSITVDYGETIQSFTTPTAPLNKAFAGWYTSLTDGVEITVPYTPESDITLIARWDDDLFPIVFSEPGECTFNGSTGVLTGTNCSYADGERKYIDTGIQLYNSENHDKDYEIGFTIVSYNSSDQVSQATFMNTKREASGYPGLVFRRKDNESGYDLSSRKTSSANERKIFSGIVIDQVKIWRIKNKDTGTQEIFYKINDGNMVKLNDLSSYNPEFELNVWFGAAPTDGQANAAQRILVGTMKDMYIKVGTYQDEVPVEYTATYDANGGIVTTTSKTVNKNEQIGELPIPTAPITMEFDGWYTGISDGIKIDETYLLNDDVTLYARYNSLCGTFSTDSWDEIVSNLNNDSSYYPVGCEKEIMVNNTTYPVRLINTTTNENCNTSSDISQTGCGFVIEFSRKIGSRPMSNSYWNDGGWKESSLRSYLNSTFYNSLSDDLKNVIIDTNPVVSGSGKGGVSANANDKVFVLALSEVGRHDFNNDTKSGMRTLDYYLLKDLPGFKIHLGWLRTAEKSSNSNYFLGMGGSVASADYSTGEVTPAFRIGIKPKYIVSFDTDEGSSVTSQTITYGAKATRPTTDPTKEGYTFDNWYTDDTYTTVFDFDNTVITSDTTIYAKFYSPCKTFATDSWTTIRNNLESDSSYYAVGCEKEVEIDMDDDGTNESYTVRLANTSTPEVCSTEGYSQTACGTVIEFADIVDERPMNSTKTNAGGWKETAMVTYLNSEFYNKLPSSLQSVIIPTYPIVSGSGSGGISDNITDNDTTKNKMYLLSTREIGLDSEYDNKRNELIDTRTLDYYSTNNNNNARIKKDLTDTDKTWWLRSAFWKYDSSFCYETNFGTHGYGYANYHSVGLGVAPAFRIGTMPEFTVSFNTDGGSSVSSQTITYGAKATRPTTDPTKEGYTFDNWYTDDTYQTVFDFDNTVITNDTTIYAGYNNESNIVLPTGRTKDNLEVGDEVCINGNTIECFNFIRYDGNDIVLLSKWNLKVGTINEVVSGALVEIGRYTDSDEGYGVQSSDVRGAVANGLWNGTLPFAASFYWSDGSGIKSKYGGLRDSNDIYDIDYSSEPDFNNLGYETPGYSVAYYVRNYENILKSYGAPIKTSRLITYDEVTDPSIGCDHEELSCPTTGFITNTTFWLGSAHDDTYIWFIDTGGYFSNGDINDYSSGIRPVVIIDKADL